MAEDTTPFSSLDPLGPEYGRADLPTIDAQGLSPFEGDKIEDPKINFPKQEVPQFHTMMPGTGGMVNPHYVVKKVTGQPPGKAGVQGTISMSDLYAATHAQMKGAMTSAQSKGTYGGRYNYNAGPSGNAYYKKYHAL